MFRMMKKGQAAMEFLMTYGWAILVVLAAIAALAYFGVLSPDQFLPERCTLPSGIACLDATGSGDTISLRIQNSLGYHINITSMELDADGVGSINCQNATGADSWRMNNGEAATVECTHTENLPPGKISSDVIMEYDNLASGLSHTRSGSLMLGIE